ncbi:MAG: hypothetical protein ACYDBJ_15215 [Aggregatilineales bacterium]
MDRKLSVVANVRYQTPKGNGAGKLKGLLRYIQYRDDCDGHIPQEQGLERWTDHGLGHNVQTIAANCDTAKSNYVQAFTFVINPNPDLIAFIPEDRRVNFVKELTEATMDSFLAERGIEGLEYSYALHRRETTDAKEPGRDNPHTHVILPGTYFSWQDGKRLPLYMNRNKRENHIQLLHQIAQQEIDRLLQREIGRDWEQRYDLAALEREALRLLAEVPELELPTLEPEIQPEAGSPGLSLDL